MLTPGASLDDGLLDACLVSDLPIRRVLQVIPSVLKGQHGKHPEVTMEKARKIRIKSDRPVSIHRDGEVPTDKVDDIEMRIEPGCLNILV